MKIGVFNRILLFISMIFMLAIGVGVAMVCTTFTTFSKLAQYAEQHLVGFSGTAILIAVSAVIILVALKLLIAVFTFPKSEEKKDAVENITLKSGEDGNIMVSSDLVKDIASRCAKSSDDVKDVDCRILCRETGVKVLMKFYLKRDIVLNDFLAQKQVELKEYIEKHAGITVAEIDLCADVSDNTSRLR